jgi:hypothetical protein
MTQHPVPVVLLTHIGDITVSFALLEGQIQFLVAGLIGRPQRVGQILGSYLSFSNLRAAAISLYLDRHGEDADFATLKDLMVRSGKIEEERNRITHSMWGAGGTPSTAARLKITARESRGFHFESDLYDETRLASFASEVKKAASDIMRFTLKLADNRKV